MGRKAKIKANRRLHRELDDKFGSLPDDFEGVAVNIEPLPGGGVRRRVSFRGDAADHAARLWMDGKLTMPPLDDSALQ